MKKNLLIVTLFVILAYVGVTLFNTPVSHIDHDDNSILNDISESEPNSSSLKQDERGAITSSTNTFNANIDSDISEEEVINIIAVCGFSEEEFVFSSFESIPFHISDFSERQKEIYDGYRKKCNTWHSGLEYQEKYVHLIDKEKAAKKRIKSIHAMFIDKDSEAIANNIQIAKNVLNGKDNTFHETSALNYLAQYDYDFRNRIAEKIGTENTGYVSRATKDYLQIYRCKQKPTECSSNSLKMITMCFVEDRFCDKSYHEFLALKMTPNQLDDLYSMANAVEEILAEGYPL